MLAEADRILLARFTSKQGDFQCLQLRQWRCQVSLKKRQSKLIPQLVSLIERSHRQMGKRQKKKDKEGWRRGLIKSSSFT